MITDLRDNVNYCGTIAKFADVVTEEMLESVIGIMYAECKLTACMSNPSRERSLNDGLSIVHRLPPTLKQQ